MPINTRELLQSAAGVGFLPLGPNVTPTSPLDQEWLQQSAWGYSGVLAATPGAPPPAAGFTTRLERDRRRYLPRSVKRRAL